MRTHVSVKTWLIQRNGEAIGTVRASGRTMTPGKSIEAVIHNKPQTIYIINVHPEQRIIEV